MTITTLFISLFILIQRTQPFYCFPPTYARPHACALLTHNMCLEKLLFVPAACLKFPSWVESMQVDSEHSVEVKIHADHRHLHSCILGLALTGVTGVTWAETWGQQPHIQFMKK